MIFNDVIYGSTSYDMVQINKFEISARLGSEIDLNSDLINQYIAIFNENVAYRYAYVKLPFKYENGNCYIDDIEIQSAALSRVLNDAKYVYLLAVTTGIGIDKLISKMSIQNTVGSYYIDGIASASIESYIDHVNDILCNGLNVTKRFSPGYSDFPIEFQDYLLNRLSAKETLGIMLSDDNLMIPTKSITAVIGIK